MKNEDQLTDALLKEHAKHGAGADEKFLKELEERLDANEAGDKVVAMPKKSAGSRWALGTGIAACLALGFGGVQFWEGYQKSQVVRVTPEVTSYTDPLGLAAAPKSPTDHRTAYDNTPSELLVEGGVELELGKELQSKHEGNKIKVVIRGKQHELKLKQGAQRPMKHREDLGAASASLGISRVRGRGDSLKEMAAKPLTLSEPNTIEIGGNSVDAAAPPMAKRSLRVNGRFTSNEDSFFGAASKLIAQKEEKRRGALHCEIPPSGKSIERFNNERYGQLVENKFKAPIDERSALSTFAVDVDTASYANLRRMINHGQRVPADAVRIEEMVNYFDYQYAQPKGEHPFAVHVDSAACPWNEKHRLVRIGVQGKEIIREERPATNLVFLLDVSGSMNSSNKLPLLKKSMKYLLEELNDQDTVSIVVYAGASGLALPATKVDEAGRQKIEQTMNRLSAGGSTAGGQGIKLAYKVAKENFKKDGVNRIILATDGDFNVGVSDNASLTKLVKEKAKQGTYLSVLGFGHGNINDAMLESITNSGNGNYSYIDSVKEGRKVLLEDMMGTMVTIAKDVKVQVVMNPNKVKAYRLIGYANRMLPPEAFLDKKVDAGEIGAGHTVTALYEIVPADGTPFGDKIDASRYFKKPEAKPNVTLKDSPEMMFVKLAYKQPDQKMEDGSTYVSKPFVELADAEMSDDMKFASAVGLLGMVVRESEHKGSGDLNKVLELAKASKGPDGKGQRAEFIKLVEKLSERK